VYPSGINMENSSVTLRDVTVGTCRCGGAIKVVEGLHVTTSDGGYYIDSVRQTWHVTRGRTRRELQDLRQALTRIQTEEQSPEQADATVKKAAPWFAEAYKNFNQSGRRNDGALNYVMVLIAILTLIIALRGAGGVKTAPAAPQDSQINLPAEHQLDEEIQRLITELEREHSTPNAGPSANQRCYCGRKKKYKDCHGHNGAQR
jgi:hypothetical protein